MNDGESFRTGYRLTSSGSTSSNYYYWYHHRHIMIVTVVFVVVEQLEPVSPPHDIQFSERMVPSGRRTMNGGCWGILKE